MKKIVAKILTVLGDVALFLAPSMVSAGACTLAHGERPIPECLKKNL